MMRLRLGSAVGMAMVAGVVGVVPASAGSSGGPMTPAQAQRAYLNAVCPMGDAIDTMYEAEQAADAKWSTVRPLVKATGDQQMRAVRRLDHPRRPWPADIRAFIPAYTDLFLTSAGANYTLSSAGSLEDYRAQLKRLQKDLPATLKAQTKVYLKARPIVLRRLGLPSDDPCASQ